MRHPIIEEDLRSITAAGLPWERLAGKTVLVTGAAGFLPAYMVETLLYLNETRKLGIKAVALVRDRARAEIRYAHYLGRPDLAFEARDIGLPLAPMGRADVIIHAASQASPAFYDTDPVGTLRPNVIGTANLLELARAWGSENFLFLSSGEVYGQVDPARMPITEDVYGYTNPVLVRACYGESKRMGETMCVAWSHQYGVPAKIVRPFHTYGPGIRFDDGRVFADFVADIVQGRDITMKSDGSAQRVFCYLADAVLGFFTVLLNGQSGEAYNITNEDAEIGILELAERLVRLFPEKGLKVIRRPREAGDRYLPSPISRSTPSTRKARALGWRPVVGIDEGFLRTIRSYG
jgi:UDP-glucuronate decarboxylase